MVYFDNAATSYPKPSEVSDAVLKAIREFGGNPGRSGHKMSMLASKTVYAMRENVAEFFGNSDSDRVVLTKNCTESLNIAIFGILKDGGNAVVSNFEHNSVMRPLEFLKNSGVANYKVAKVSFENPVLTSHEFERLIDKDTKMIICTHASNVTGKIAPIAELSDICRRRKLIFCVDASQTAGIVDIDMERDGIDILCCPGHKGLLAPSGTGLLLCKKNISLSPVLFGGTGSLSGSFTQPDFLPDMLESGTVNVPGAAGISAGISFIKRVGIKTISESETDLSKRFYERLFDLPNIMLYTGIPNEKTAVPTVSFNVKGKASTDISTYLDSKNIAVRSGLHCSPLAHSFIGTQNTGTVRASFSVYNNKKEIDYAIRQISEKL